MPTDPPHTLSNFDEGLKVIKEEILLMSSSAVENLSNAVHGLLERDEARIKTAVDGDETVNQYERTIGENGTEVLVRFAPVATDLRSVLGAIKISTNLERISDEAEHIARRAKKLTKKPEAEAAAMIEPIFRIAEALVTDAARAYADGNVDLALTLYARDLELDDMHKAAIKKLTRAMESDVDALRSYLHLIFVVRCLERIGDHAVNIGEEVVYIHRAADIRHVGPAALDS
ncbi:MAG: phosphate signaling complex protein PhoU [Verrucomicrobiota bacterium]